MNIIDVEHICFSYGDKEVLKDISFSIPKGDFFCILGHNGTGKTTLLKLLLNILKPTSGHIQRNFKKLSYVSQKATGFNQDFPATVKEIVNLGLYEKGFDHWFHPMATNEKIKNALNKVGMEEKMNAKIGALSGGQQQRVFLAKAIVGNPDILFLDEPTVGIDVNAIQTMTDTLQKLNTLEGVTIVVVTHDMDVFQPMATNILNIG